MSKIDRRISIILPEKILYKIKIKILSLENKIFDKYGNEGVKIIFQ